MANVRDSRKAASDARRRGQRAGGCHLQGDREHRRERRRAAALFVNNITTGTDAQGEVTVRLEKAAAS